MSSAAPDSPKCAYCHEPASLTCSACKDAPVYEQGIEKTWYCTVECQKQHWVVHKHICNILKERRTFFRLGDTLQKIFYAYREKMFDRPVASIDERGEKLFVTDGDWNDDQVVTGLDYIFSFPSAMCKKPEHKEALLVCMACTDAVGWMHDLIEYIMPGFTSEIIEVLIPDMNQKREVIIVEEGGKHNSTNDYAHHLWKVQLKKSKERFALDLTGAQFGYHDPVVPWGIYTRDHVRHIKYPPFSLRPFGSTKIECLRTCETRLDQAGLIHNINRRTCVIFELSLLKWEVAKKVTLESMLTQPQAVFEQGQGQLIGRVHLELRALLTDMAREFKQKLDAMAAENLVN